MKDLDLSFEEFRDLLEVFPIAGAVYEAVKDLNRIQFLTLLGGVIDRWATRHKLTQKETFEILEMLAAAQKQVHAVIGPATGGIEKAPEKQDA